MSSSWLHLDRDEQLINIWSLFDEVAQMIGPHKFKREKLMKQDDTLDVWLFQFQIFLFFAVVSPFLILHASTKKWPVWETNLMNNRSKLYTFQGQRYRWRESGWSRARTAMFRTKQGGWKCNNTTGSFKVSLRIKSYW